MPEANPSKTAQKVLKAELILPKTKQKGPPRMGISTANKANKVPVSISTPEMFLDL